MKETVKELLDIGAKEAARRIRALGFSEPEATLRNLKILSEGPFAPFLDDILALAALSPSPDGALNHLEPSAGGGGGVLTRESLSSGGKTLAQLFTICGSSAFLPSILSQPPPFYGWI